jgi:hypothetical protein
VSTVGVFGIQFDGWYEDWIDGWFDACLLAQPDQIVLVCDQDRWVPDGVQLIVAPPCDQRYPIPYYSNIAVSALTTDWCWNMDIDDLIYPDALQEIRVVDADVYAAGLLTSTGTKALSRRLDCDRVWRSLDNLVNAGSAFRKSMWVQVGGYPDIGFHDWGLWRLMAREQARFVASGWPLYWYRTGHNSVSKNFDVELYTKEVFGL